MSHSETAAGAFPGRGSRTALLSSELSAIADDARTAVSSASAASAAHGLDESHMTRPVESSAGRRP
jgi:hypothetical protein